MKREDVIKSFSFKQEHKNINVLRVLRKNGKKYHLVLHPNRFNLIIKAHQLKGYMHPFTLKYNTKSLESLLAF